jgi:polyhydroxyalkanoate synthesis regulator phasin
MKKSIFVLLGVSASALGVWALSSFITSPFGVPAEGITFHRVNLVCGAATDIGCGSRSKPILLDLEKQESIAEAWLNRAGTMVAIVWKGGLKPDVKAVPAVFKKHNKSITTLSGAAYDEQLANFRNDKWYRGAQVDELSMEEAGRIAREIIDPLVADGVLSKEYAPKMFAEVEKYIQHQFEVLEDVSLLSTAEYYDGWERDIRKMAEQYISKDKIPDLEMCGPSRSSCEEGTKDKSCPPEKKSCYSKPRQS